MTSLSVNVDHVATVRQARGVEYPDPVEAARQAELAGARGITVHLRGDRRHIQDRDVEALRAAVRGKLNLEMAVTREMLDIALGIRPDQVTLVPERDEEVTTEGGLDVAGTRDHLARAAAELAGAGIAVSLFVDPEPEHVASVRDLDGIVGFEINTDRYTRAGAAGEREAELERVRRAAARGGEAGLAVYAGHGLTTGNVGAVAAIPPIEELNIGHSIVARALLVGFQRAVREMLAAIRRGFAARA